MGITKEEYMNFESKAMLLHFINTAIFVIGSTQILCNNTKICAVVYYIKHKKE